MPENRKKLFLAWKFVLIPIFIFIAIHFLKDITQDLLGVSTFLDVFGDVKEDLSAFPNWLVWVYHWAGVNTFLMEGFLLFSIPKTWGRKAFSKVDLVNAGFLLYIVAIFIIATFLGPQ